MPSSGASDGLTFAYGAGHMDIGDAQREVRARFAGASTGRSSQASCGSCRRRRVSLAMYWSSSLGIGAWYTGAMLVLFAGVGRAMIRREARGGLD
jgi:hypothetical protein